MERLPLRPHPALAFMGTALIVAAAFLLRWVAHLPGAYPFISFFPATLLAALLFGWRQGLVAGVLGGGLAWFFFIPRVEGPGVPGALLLAMGFFVLVAGGLVLIAFLLQRTIMRLADAREQNRLLAETRELLFRELQHRVSNNLQVAAGLLALQKRHIADADARTAIEEAARRLGVIGRISRQLYRPDGAGQSLTDLLEPLCRDVVEASGKAVELRFRDTAHTPLPPDAAVPVALIVAEAVANAIEHGVGGRPHGIVEVDCLCDGPALRIEVRDDGDGLREGFDPAAHGSLGLRIATMFAAQIGARFELIDGKGATARLMLPDRVAP